jgi:hypothetical protein
MITRVVLNVDLLHRYITGYQLERSMFQEVGMDEKLSFPENVVFREEPEGGILFNVDTGDMRIVEDVAWGICKLIDMGSSRQEILNQLALSYPDQDSLEADLDSFVEELKDLEMVSTG